MDNLIWNIEIFSEQHEKQWDQFVMQDSLNGTFLHTRNFLNYHKKGKFEDISLEIYKKNKLVAVCPACLITEKEEKTFFSHLGSTFGGIILNKDIYRAEDMIELVGTVEEFLKSIGISKIVMKLPPDFFCKAGMSLLEYVFRYEDYASYVELNSYIDLECDDEIIWQRIDRNKKRNISKCKERKLWFRKLDRDEEIAQFYDLLKINLSKHGLKPVHSYDEILEFRHVRLKDETLFYGVGLEEQILAAGMLFVFDSVNVLHAQNLSYNPFVEREYSPITYLYYKVIMEAKKKGYSKLTWGVSTEDHGRMLNRGLIRNKESFGSGYFLNTTYYKSIGC